METSLLFEAFVVFYLLELLVLFSVAVWYYHEPKIIVVRKSEIEPQGPTAAQAMAMYKVASKIKREQSVRD